MTLEKKNILIFILWIQRYLSIMEESKNINKNLNSINCIKVSNRQFNKRNLTIPTELIQKDNLLNDEEITLEVSIWKY